MTISRAAFNPAVSGMTAPPIPTVQAWARAYDGSAGSLIDLSQAVPGYPPHPSLLSNIARLAGDSSLAGYGDIEGEPALRAALANYVSAQLRTSISAANIQITSGCNQAFVVAMLALAAPGDRVLLTNPCFFNNASALQMLGLEPRFVDCAASNGFVPDPDDVARAIDAHAVRAVALVSPNNPTGAVYTAEALSAIQSVCRSKGVWLVVDETYADFIGSDQVSVEAARHQLLSTDVWEENTVLLYSFSKVYCTPGLRVGAITAGFDVVEEVTKVMDNLQICAPRHAQMALSLALPELGSWRQGNTQEILRRASAFRSALSKVPRWSISAMGAYFAYVRHPFAGASSMEIAERMARDAGLLCLPGTFFGSGQDDYLRIAFANVDVEEIGLLSERLASLSGA